MEWQHLEYFQTVARYQHMTKAAESLSISQPALSRSIARLEEDLGVPLFDRQGRAIKLNRYGHLFLIRVNRIIKELNEGKQEIQELLDPEGGEVSLGFLHTLGTHLVPDLIGSFRNHYPKVTFQLTQNGSQSLVEQLQKGEIDICFITPTEINHPIHWSKFWSEELFATVPVGHPLSIRKSISLEDIANESWIFLKKGYGLRNITDKLFQEVGIDPKIIFEGEEVGTIAGLVSVGLGVSLLPLLMDSYQDQLKQIPVHLPTCQRMIGVAWNEDRYLSPTGKQFLQFVMESFKDRER
jgi:DNA-binding transcriptional LysR family regulator